MKRIAASAAFLAALASSSSARATTPCPRAEAPWLHLETGASLSPALATAVAAKLQGELNRWSVTLCTNPSNDAPPPLAVIELTIAPDDVLTLAVVDRALEKRLARSISLRGIPKDARAFSIAVAAEELLHASWLSAFVDRQAQSNAAPAPAIESTPAVSAPDTAESPAPHHALPAVGWSLAAFVAGEHATQGESLGGFDARVSYGGTVRIDARVGVRVGLVTRTDHGTIESNAFLAGAAMALASSRRAPWGGAIFAKADAIWLTFAGHGPSAAHPASGNALACLLGGGLEGRRWLDAIGRWQLVADVSLAAPLPAVAALDDGRSVAALSGAIAGVSLGVDAAF